MGHDAFQREEGAVRAYRGALTELAMTPAEGVEVFQRVLGLHAPSQVVVSTAALESRLARWIRLEQPEAGRATEPGAAATSHPRPPLATTYVAPRNELERTIATVCGQVLGLAQVGVVGDALEVEAEAEAAVEEAEAAGVEAQPVVVVVGVVAAEVLEEAREVAEVAEVVAEAEVVEVRPKTLMRMGDVCITRGVHYVR